MNETDLKQLCRICLSNKSHCSNIFVVQSSDGNPIYEVINYVCDLDISVDDGLPEYVCQECLRIMKEFENFKRNAHRSKTELILLKEKHSVFIKVEVEDYLHCMDPDIAADGQIHVSQMDVHPSGIYGNASLEDEEMEGGLSSNHIQMMQKERLGFDDSATSPQLSSWVKDANCGSINYSEYHESEKMNNDKKPYIKQELKEVERNCSVNKRSGSDNPSTVKIARKEREKRKVNLEGKKVKKGKRKESIVVMKSEEGFSEEDYVICHHCGEKSKTKIELKEHIYHAHFSTSVGDKRSEEDSECLRKSFRCPVCQKDFKHRNGLTKHLKIHNGVKPFKCNICSYSTANGSHLRRHTYLVHSGDKPFKCSCCKYSTTVESRLKSHIYRHTIEMPYKCDKCDFKASVKARFTSHMRKHTDKKPFKCDVCDYGTAFESVLRSHMYMHIGEKPFCCDICKYGSTKKSHLKAHMCKHTSEKPFKCHICEFSSRTILELKRHAHTHTSKKPFKCHICEYSSRSTSDLKKHIHTHTGEKPLKCHICEYSTADHSSLRKHIRRHK